MSKKEKMPPMGEMPPKGKMPPMGKMPAGMPPRAHFDPKTLFRLLSYMKAYKGKLIFVVICILLSCTQPMT